MSNSYLVDLERLRVQLRQILEEKGIETTENEPLSSLIPKVEYIGINEEILDGLVDGSYSGDYKNNSSTSIKKFAFFECALRNVEMKNLTAVSESAFQNCSLLESVDAPKVTSLGNNAFSNCVNLKSVNMPILNYVNANGFQNCHSLKIFDARNIARVDSIQGWARTFESCRNLKILDFQKLALTSFYNGFTINCTELEVLHYGIASTISSASGCTSLKTLILGFNGVVVLNVAALSNTPFRNGVGGTLYIPRNLVSQYEASNWNTLESCTIDSIEDNIDYLTSLGIDMSPYTNDV